MSEKDLDSVDASTAAKAGDGLAQSQGDAAEAGDPGDENPASETLASQPLVRLSARELERGVEAVLFSTSSPVPIRQLAEIFECSVHDVRDAVENLRLDYVSAQRSYRLEDVAGGVQILTLPEYEPWIRRFQSRSRDQRLSPAAFETLAVIAYKQPINKADLEAIRGVQCSPILKGLLDRNLIKVVGHGEGLGRPLLYGTTKRFLESFGIASLQTLPQPELGFPAVQRFPALPEIPVVPPPLLDSPAADAAEAASGDEGAVEGPLAARLRSRGVDPVLLGSGDETSSE